MPGTQLRKVRVVIGAVLSIAALGSGAVFAHHEATGITAERMRVMKEMASQMKALGEMLEGRIPYDAASARANALALQQGCHAVASQFPDGTGDHPSRASPVIWEQPGKFRAQMANLQNAVGQLVTAASGPRDVVRARFVEVGRACARCHDSFRLPED
jgi:cytochrome c556